MSRQIVKRSELPQDFDIYCLCTKCFECIKCKGNNWGEKCPKFAAKGRYMREYNIEMTTNHRILIYRNEKIS